MAARGGFAPGGAGGRQCLGIDVGERYLKVIGRAFFAVDMDLSGSLNTREQQLMWQIIFKELEPKRIWQITDPIQEDLDTNRDGELSWNELEKFFKGQAREPTEVDKLIDPNLVRREPRGKEIGWLLVDIEAPNYIPVWPFLPPIKKAISFVCNAAILVSIMNFVVESLPSQQKTADEREAEGHDSASFVLESVCIAIFTVEFIVRVMFTPSQRALWFNFYTWVDVMAIVPFYMGLMLGNNPSGGLVVLRVLRLLRLVRMLKLGRSLEAVQVLVIAIQRTIKSLLVAMIGINAIATVLFASLMFTFEQDGAAFNATEQKWIRSTSSPLQDAGKEIDFQSIPVSMWWAWVTLTTVGYGDMYPLTGPGKAVASLTMVCGLIVMSFPLTLLSCSFAETMHELRMKKQAQKRGTDFLDALQKHVGPDVLKDAAAAPALPREWPVLHGGIEHKGSDQSSDQKFTLANPLENAKRDSLEPLVQQQVDRDARRSTVLTAGDLRIESGRGNATDDSLPPPWAVRLAEGVQRIDERGLRQEEAISRIEANIQYRAFGQERAIARIESHLQRLCDAKEGRPYHTDMAMEEVGSPLRSPAPRGGARGTPLLTPIPGPGQRRSGTEQAELAPNTAQWTTSDSINDILLTVEDKAPSVQQADDDPAAAIAAGQPSSPELPPELHLGETLRTLTYISQMIPNLGREETAKIEKTAHLRNAELAITGILISAEPYFLQTIEGPEENLFTLMDDIHKDPRHHSIEIISNHTLRKREMQNWALCCVTVRPASRAEMLRVAVELKRRRNTSQRGVWWPSGRGAGGVMLDKKS